MLKVKIGDSENSFDVLAHMRNELADPTPMLNDMGEYLVGSTQERFRTSTAPDGSRWAPNSQATYLNLLGDKHETKGGKLNSKGINRVMSKKPLIGEGGFGGGLAGSIHYQVSGNLLLVGTPMIYAAAQHYGATITPKNKTTLRFMVGGAEVFVKSVTLPSRQFLGISGADSDELANIAQDHMLPK